MQNKELEKKLHKSISRNFENVEYTHPLNIIFGVLIPLKDKRGITIAKITKKILFKASL